jgi:transketolase C-terminal domain/subunit
MVHECLAAADKLKESGRSATVIDAYSMPLKIDGLIEIAQKSGRRVVTVEDNYSGGLDAEVSTAIHASGADVTIKSVFVDRLPKSGREPAEVLEYVHVGLKSILSAAGGD